MNNCLTYALQIVDRTHLRPANLVWNLTPLEAIQEIASKYGLHVRSVTDEEGVSDSEWKICFFGFVPIHWDYEHRADYFDYHFLIQTKNGKWMHRKEWHSSPEEANLPKLIAEYQKFGYAPSYFAIRKGKVGI